MNKAKPKQKRKYYFAYGSNLCIRQMASRCPGALRVGPVVLPDYKLTFHTHANIERSDGDQVHGAIYSITLDDERALDRYEGFPNYYGKYAFECDVKAQNGDVRRVTVMFYAMSMIRTGPPSATYLQTILDGFADWDLPTESVYQAVDDVEARMQSMWDEDDDADDEGENGWTERLHWIDRYLNK